MSVDYLRTFSAIPIQWQLGKHLPSEWASWSDAASRSVSAREWVPKSLFGQELAFATGCALVYGLALRLPSESVSWSGWKLARHYLSPWFPIRWQKPVSLFYLLFLSKLKCLSSFMKRCVRPFTPYRRLCDHDSGMTRGTFVCFSHRARGNKVHQLEDRSPLDAWSASWGAGNIRQIPIQLRE